MTDVDRLDAQERTILRQNVEIAQLQRRIADLERIKVTLENALGATRRQSARDRAEAVFGGRE